MDSHKIPFFDTKFSFEKSGLILKGVFGTKFAFKKSKCDGEIKCSPLIHRSPKPSPMFDRFHKHPPSLDPFVHSSCTLSQQPADGFHHHPISHWRASNTWHIEKHQTLSSLTVD
jgi:hypothetical protein